jgi:cardiolipin synthase (CMP-forming)
MKWIPNALSLARILVAPVVAWLIYAGMVAGDVMPLRWAFGLFVVSALTDWFDGYLARVLDANWAENSICGATSFWWD